MSIPELVSQHFVKLQWIIGIASLLFFYTVLKSGNKKSQFKVREADRTDFNRLRSGPDLAQAKLKNPKVKTPSPPPLSLPGIRLEGEAHEILGVAEEASEIEIMKAYKDAIKRFHPDRIQGQAQEQLQFYQQTSAKLNQAKVDMLKNLRARKV